MTRSQPTADRLFRSYDEFFDWLFKHWNLKDSETKIEINNIIYDSPSEVLEAYDK